NIPDNGDLFLDNIKVEFWEYYEQRVQTTSDSGKYEFEEGGEYYQVAAKYNGLNHAYFELAFVSIHIENYGNIDTVNFKVTASALVNDASIALSKNGNTVSGQKNSYTITYANRSGQNYNNGTIELNLDGRLDFLSAEPAPTSISENTLVW